MQITRILHGQLTIGSLTLLTLLAAGNLSIVCSRQALAYESDAYYKLKASRDALIAQQKELNRAYGDIERKIDDLSKRRSVLSSYMRQLDRSIRDVEDAMKSIH